MDQTHNIIDDKLQRSSDTQNLSKASGQIKLVVIGVGGGGNNAIKMVLENRFEHVQFVVANTDDQALELNPCPNKLRLGKDSRGLGTGSDPEKGEKSAYDSLSDIQNVLKGADIVIVVAGFGGGTGTGAAPVIADIARQAGALTIGIVTTPFEYEVQKRRKVAFEGIKKLAKCVDSYIVISNDKLVENFGDIPVSDAFQLANITLKNIIVAIYDILYRIGTINIDFADVKHILSGGGLSVVGIGQSSGKDRATKAVINAFEQNLYEYPVRNAKKILVNLQFDKSTTMKEVSQAVKKVHQILSQNLNGGDNNDYECIIGQETVETKDNTELFKISIIATAVEILNNELDKEKAPMLTNYENQHFTIEHEDKIKPQFAARKQEVSQPNLQPEKNTYTQKSDIINSVEVNGFVGEDDERISKSPTTYNSASTFNQNQVSQVNTNINSPVNTTNLKKDSDNEYDDLIFKEFADESDFDKQTKTLTNSVNEIGNTHSEKVSSAFSNTNSRFNFDENSLNDSDRDDIFKETKPTNIKTNSVFDDETLGIQDNASVDDKDSNDSEDFE